MPDPRHILVTRELTEEQLALATRLGLHATVEPAISISFRDDWNSARESISPDANILWAFTSRNGVEAFGRMIEGWQAFPDPAGIYSVGEKTAEALKALGFDGVRAPQQQDAVGLATLITSDMLARPELKEAAVWHMCGNRRRDEFRQMLSASDITVKDIVGYRTELQNMNVQDTGRRFEAVLFYSPSAVQAFRDSGGFAGNELPELFAIGHTTAEELSIESGRHVHISPEPDTDVFLEFVGRTMSSL
ncbi:MAG: uroporphyrinogen-III synthase [Balneolaceae bacterium]